MTAQLLITLDRLAREINKAGIVATAISKFSLASIQESAGLALITHFASESVFIYIEQNKIKDAISDFMDNEAAIATSKVAKRLLIDIIQVEQTYRYSIVMPAINHLIL